MKDSLRDKNDKFKPDGFHVDAFCIGAAKCASTWLASVVDEHPEVQVSKPKEPKFLTHLSGNIYLSEPAGPFLADWEWYWSCFPDSGKVNVDFTVHMLADRAAPYRVRSAFPDARFILVLRDPVQRAWSHYHHLLRAKAAGSHNLKGVEPSIDDPEYLRRSRYAEQLRPWLEVFSSDRFLVVTKEEAEISPLDVVKKVYRHLGVDDGFVPGSLGKRLYPGSLRSRFLKGLVKSAMPGFLGRLLTRYPKMRPEQEASLRESFSGDIERLESLFGLDLRGWKARE